MYIYIYGYGETGKTVILIANGGTNGEVEEFPVIVSVRWRKTDGGVDWYEEPSRYADGYGDFLVISGGESMEMRGDLYQICLKLLFLQELGYQHAQSGIYHRTRYLSFWQP